MDNQKLLSTQADEKISKYWNEKDPKRRWEVGLDYKTKVYLTDEEHEYLIAKLAEGVTIVQIGDLTLTPKFLYILPIKEKPTAKKFEEVKNGKGETIGFKEI